MLYCDFSKDETGRELPGWHAAFSPDGIHWRKHAKAPLNKTSYGGRGLQPPFANEDPYAERWDSRKSLLRKTWAYPYTMSDAVDVFWDPKRELYAVYGKSWLHGPGVVSIGRSGRYAGVWCLLLAWTRTTSHRRRAVIPHPGVAIEAGTGGRRLTGEVPLLLLRPRTSSEIHAVGEREVRIFKRFRCRINFCPTAAIRSCIPL